METQITTSFNPTREDPYPYEQRWRTTGWVRPSVMIIFHTWVDGSPGRIISAPKANRTERKRYAATNG